jgi:hypothetical protein
LRPAGIAAARTMAAAKMNAVRRVCRIVVSPMLAVREIM